MWLQEVSSRRRVLVVRSALTCRRGWGAVVQLGECAVAVVEQAGEVAGKAHQAHLLGQVVHAGDVCRASGVGLASGAAR